jgi:hypothetical protein
MAKMDVWRSDARPFGGGTSSGRAKGRGGNQGSSRGSDGAGNDRSH